METGLAVTQSGSSPLPLVEQRTDERGSLIAHKNNDSSRPPPEEMEDKTKDTNTSPLATTTSRWILPEIPTGLYLYAFAMQIPVTQFWLYQYFSEQYDCAVSENGSDHFGRTRTTSETNGSVWGLLEKEEAVQSKANFYIMYTRFVEFFVAVFPTLFLGALTDVRGRKFAVYFGSLLDLASLSLVLSIFFFRLSPDLLFVSSLLKGLSGNFALFMAAMYGITYDIASSGNRLGFRIACVEAALNISASVSIVTSGVWVEKTGYVCPTAVAIGCKLSALLYVAFLVPETLPPTSRSAPSCTDIFYKSFQVFVKGARPRRQFKLVVNVACMLLSMVTLIGENNVGYLYLLHRPFVWSEGQITAFFGVTRQLKWFVVLLIVVVGKPKSKSQPLLALLSCLSAAVMFLIRGLANTSLIFILGAAVGLLSELMNALCRTMATEAVLAREQGALQASIGVLHLLANSLTGLALSNIYSAGLKFYLGLPYLVLAAVMFVGVLLLLALIIREKRQPNLESDEDVCDYEELIE